MPDQFDPARIREFSTSPVNHYTVLVQEWWYCRTTRPKGEILLLWQHNYPLNSIVNYIYMYLSGSLRGKKRQIVLRHRADVSFCLASGLLSPLSNKDFMTQIDNLAKPKLLMCMEWVPMSLRSNSGAHKVHNSLNPFINSKRFIEGLQYVSYFGRIRQLRGVNPEGSRCCQLYSDGRRGKGHIRIITNLITV